MGASLTRDPDSDGVSFETEPYTVDRDDAWAFAVRLDPNPAHLLNETVSGLYVVALSNRAVLGLPGFERIINAVELRVRFQSPVHAGMVLRTRGVWRERVSRSRVGTLIRRSTCEVVTTADRPVIEYDIVQFLAR